MFTRIIISQKHGRGQAKRGLIMNKQELIDKLKRLLEMPSEIQGTELNFGHDYGIRRAIALAEQLDEPKKPVVPKYVADWIEWCKKNKITFLGADTAICNNKNIRSLDASGWAMKNQETFAKAWLYGYEIKKEKLYTVEIPIANSPLGYHYVLRKTISGGIIIDSFFNNNWENYDYCQLTESEIKEDFAWAWKYAKEVEKCNQKH